MITRASRPHGVEAPSEPGSEAIAQGFANQQNVEVLLRSALEILAGAQPLDRHGLYVSLERDELDTLTRKLTIALRALQLIAEDVARADRGGSRPNGTTTYSLTPKGLTALFDELEEPAGIDVVSCVFCRCTQNSACSIDSALLDDVSRQELGVYFADQGVAELPPRVSCYWISLDPPVCSNPLCRRAFAKHGGAS